MIPTGAVPFSINLFRLGRVRRRCSAPVDAETLCGVSQMTREPSSRDPYQRIRTAMPLYWASFLAAFCLMYLAHAILAGTFLQVPIAWLGAIALFAGVLNPLSVRCPACGGRWFFSPWRRVRTRSCGRCGHQLPHQSRQAKPPPHGKASNADVE